MHRLPNWSTFNIFFNKRINYIISFHVCHFFINIAMTVGIMPVIGIPLPGGMMDGLDSLLATVNMPKGVPVATVSMGKVLEARDAGEPIPDGWAMDKNGNMTNDPNLASILMPLGGAKGSSLSLMFECLVSLMGSNPLIASLIMPGADPSGFRQNGLAIAIKIQYSFLRN